MALENILTFFLQQKAKINKIHRHLWWKFIPGVKVKVKWPTGSVIKEFLDQYKTDDQLFSADPNEHYRPWLEREVGWQGVSWDWTMEDDDMSNNLITIKFRKGKEEYAAVAALMWK